MQVALRNTFCFAALALAGTVFAAQNLIVNGDMSDAARFAAECQLYGEEGVKLSRFTEDLTWNLCGKVELTAPHKPCEYGTVIIGTGAKGALQGFAVEPGGTYEISFGVRGTPGKLRVNVVTWTGDEEWKGRQNVPTSLGLVTVKENWTTCRGTVTLGPDVKRAALMLRLWRDEKKGEAYKGGEHFLFDNVSVKDRQGGVKELAAKHSKPFALASVPVTVDMQVPFVPNELANPVTNLRVRAAVNELKAVPLALANLTAQSEEYRVSLETRAPEKGVNSYDGRFGLNGLDPACVTMRKGLRYRQSRWIEDGLKIDPLVRMDEARTISVPPMEAGLVWIDFDLTGVKPGVYRGILRVLPFTGEGYFTREGGYHSGFFKGPSQDFPFELEVLPIVLDREPSVPACMDGLAVNEDMFRYMVDAGCRDFLLTPWAFMFATNAAGEAVASTYQPQAWEGGNMRQVIADHLAWAKRYGTRVIFQVAFNSYEVVSRMYGVKMDTLEGDRLWASWLKAVAALMRELGLGWKDWSMEVWDEPHPTEVESLLRGLRILREVTPEMQVTVPFVSQPNHYPLEELKRVMPYIDTVYFHDETYFRNPGFHDYIASLKASGKTVYHYTCSTRMFEDLDREFRQNAWMAERWNLDGNNIFHIVDAQGGTGASDWKTPMGGGLLYRSYETFVPSVRYMALRQGVQDVKYVTALKKLAWSDKATFESLAKAAKRVTDNPAGGDPTLADRVRDEIADQILKLQGK